jgi:hypothetical protein
VPHIYIKYINGIFVTVLIEKGSRQKRRKRGVVLYFQKSHIQFFHYLFTHKTLYRDIICRTDNDTFAQMDISILTLINPQCLTATTQATAGTIDHPCAKHRTVFNSTLIYIPFYLADFFLSPLPLF